MGTCIYLEQVMPIDMGGTLGDIRSQTETAGDTSGPGTAETA